MIWKQSPTKYPVYGAMCWVQSQAIICSSKYREQPFLLLNPERRQATQETATKNPTVASIYLFHVHIRLHTTQFPFNPEMIEQLSNLYILNLQQMKNKTREGKQLWNSELACSMKEHSNAFTPCYPLTQILLTIHVQSLFKKPCPSASWLPQLRQAMIHKQEIISCA